jgi:tetratricopeptide (TPR) repeat protein
MMQKAVEIALKEYGENDFEYAMSVYALANLYLGLGKYYDAEKYYNLALEIALKGDGDYNTIMCSLAQIQLKIGKFDEAEKLFEKALESRRKQFGENHQSVASILQYIAQVYERQTKYKEAEETFKVIFNIYFGVIKFIFCIV